MVATPANDICSLRRLFSVQSSARLDSRRRTRRVGAWYALKTVKHRRQQRRVHQPRRDQFQLLQGGLYHRARLPLKVAHLRRCSAHLALNARRADPQALTR